MKTLIVLLILTCSISAFANPFSNFDNTYDVTSAPQVAMKGMSYCDWMGFREMTSVTISLQNGVYVADVASKINNSPVHSFLTFEEYTYTGEFGVTSTAKILGTNDSATYQMVDSASPFMGSPGSMEANIWTISKIGDRYHLRLSNEVSHTSSVSSCIYDVDLAKH